MSIRPIEMQSMVQKASEIYRANTNENQRPEVIEQQFAQQLHKQIQQSEQQAQNPNKSENADVDKDGKGKGAGGSSGGKKKPKRKNKYEIMAVGESGSLFDVLI